MKPIIKALFLILLFTANTGLTIYFTMKYAHNQNYEGKLQSFKYELDDSIPFLTSSDDTSILLENPDRGFRMESYMTLGTNLSYPYRTITQEDEEDTPTSIGAYDALQIQLERYSQDKPTIIQQYIYLTLYNEREVIPEKALDELTEYFEHIRTLGIKMLLRFAYENENNQISPTHEVMFAHIAQLKTWFSDNEQLIADTVYCLQLGFIGWWGEGHSYHYNYNIPAIIEAVCEMVPSWMYVNVRTLAYYYNTPVQYLSRVGIHDDFLIGFFDNWSTVMPNDPWKQPYYRELFQRTINDGEMVWGGYPTDDFYIEGMVVTQYVYDYSLSTLSIVHNYIESGLSKPYNMYRWKSEYLSPIMFRNLGWNYNPNLLNENERISIFDYLKYHLGYQLVLSNLRTDDGKLGFIISNYGFAAPFNMDKLELHVNNKDHSTDVLNLTYTPHGLYSYGQLHYSVPLDFEEVDNVTVKLYNSKNLDYVRFANDVESVDGFYQLL